MPQTCRSGRHDLSDPANVARGGNGTQCRPCRAERQAAWEAGRRDKTTILVTLDPATAEHTIEAYKAATHQGAEPFGEINGKAVYEVIAKRWHAWKARVA